MRPTRRSHEGRVVMKVIARHVSRWYVRENRVSSLGIRSGELAKSLIVLKMIG